MKGRWFLVMRPTVAYMLQVLVAGMAWVSIFSPESTLSGAVLWASIIGLGFLQATLLVNYAVYLDRWLGRRRAARRAAEDDE